MSGDQLHATRDLAFALIEYHQSDAVGCKDIIPHRKPVAASGFEQPAHRRTLAFAEFKNPLPVVAALCQVPNLMRYEMVISSKHDVPFPGLNANLTVEDLKLCFRARKHNLRPLLAKITTQCYLLSIRCDGLTPSL